MPFQFGFTSTKAPQEPPPPPRRLPLVKRAVAPPEDLTNAGRRRPADPKPVLTLSEISRQPARIPALAFFAVPCSDDDAENDKLASQLLVSHDASQGLDKESLLKNACAVVSRISDEGLRSRLRATIVAKYCELAASAAAFVHAEAHFRDAIDLDTGVDALSALMARLRLESALTPELARSIAISTLLADRHGTAVDPKTSAPFAYPPALHAQRNLLRAQWESELEARGVQVAATTRVLIDHIVRIIIEYAAAPDRAVLVELTKRSTEKAAAEKTTTGNTAAR